MGTGTVADTSQTRTGRLQDKVAVITGASSGIGHATMKLFGSQGARSTRKLEEGLEHVRAAGSDGMIVPADLEDTDTAAKVYPCARCLRPRSTSSSATPAWAGSTGIDNPGTMAGIHEASLENWRDIIGGVDLEGYLKTYACST